MSRTLYQMYQEQVFSLAKTLIVKHEELATAINYEAKYHYNVPYGDNPYDWRYYRNLAGEYHEVDYYILRTDYRQDYMYITVSTDDGPIEVPFTKELIYGPNGDRSIVNEFGVGSTGYNNLVARYPKLEALIIGILNPVDIDTAIKVPNSEILYIAGRYKKIDSDGTLYFEDDPTRLNTKLIEPQEHNLIDGIQDFIHIWNRHWMNSDYIEGNDLYVVANLAVLYSQIPSRIMNIRLGNCKTPYVHSFHIKMYLESRGQIGRYIDFIPFETSIWLYMYCIWLEANSGKMMTFDKLLFNLLTKNDIPLRAWNIRHELSGLGKDSKLLPNALLYKEILNFEIEGASDDDRTVKDILQDQIPLARENDRYIDEYDRTTNEAIEWGGDDKVLTKVLESELMDFGEPYPFTFESFLLNHWGYTAFKGYYKGTLFVTNPLNGSRVALTPKNAYILTKYLLNYAVTGKKLQRIAVSHFYNIPATDNPDDFPTHDLQHRPKPTLQEAISWSVAEHTRKQKIAEVLGTHVPKFRAGSPQEFHDNTRENYLERVRKYEAYCDTEDLQERGDLELIAKRCYWFNFPELLADESYTDWFKRVGVDISGFNEEDMLTMALEIISVATGVSTEEINRKKWMQKSLLAIMKHFISYTVHIIEKFIEGKVAYLEGQVLRFSHFSWRYVGDIDLHYSVAIDFKSCATITDRWLYDIGDIFSKLEQDKVSKYKYVVDIPNIDFLQRQCVYDLGVYALDVDVHNFEQRILKFYKKITNPPVGGIADQTKYVISKQVLRPAEDYVLTKFTATEMGWFDPNIGSNGEYIDRIESDLHIITGSSTIRPRRIDYQAIDTLQSHGVDITKITGVIELRSRNFELVQDTTFDTPYIQSITGQSDLKARNIQYVDNTTTLMVHDIGSIDGTITIRSRHYEPNPVVTVLGSRLEGMYGSSNIKPRRVDIVDESSFIIEPGVISDINGSVTTISRNIEYTVEDKASVTDVSFELDYEQIINIEEINDVVRSLSDVHFELEYSKIIESDPIVDEVTNVTDVDFENTYDRKEDVYVTTYDPTDGPDVISIVSIVLRDI